MSTNAIQSTSSVHDLADSITKKLDVDGDGNLSSVEFSNFLTQFLGSLQSQTVTETATASDTASTTSSEADRTVVGTMAGFDPAKMADLSHDTTKYTIGRILQYYPNTPAGCVMR